MKFVLSRYSNARIHGAYRQDELPWSFANPSSIVGRFLLPLAYGDSALPSGPSPGAYPSTYAADLRTKLDSSSQPLKPDFVQTCRIIRSWFSFEIQGVAEQVANATFLTRVLTVLQHLTSARYHSDEPTYDAHRLGTPFVPVPAGNLDTLLWLAWRYVAGFADRLRALEHELEMAYNADEFDAIANDMLSHAGFIPAHWLPESFDYSMSESSLFLWPGQSLARIAKRNLIALADALVIGGGRSVAILELSKMSRSSMAPVGSPFTAPIRYRSLLETTHGDTLKTNFMAYCHSAERVLDAVVSLLRVVGHVALRLQRYLHPTDASLGLAVGTNAPRAVRARLRGWKRIAAAVNCLEGHENLFAREHFTHSWRASGVELGILAQFEHRLTGMCQRYGWVAVVLLWGAYPGFLDSINFAGRCMPRSSKLLGASTVYGTEVRGAVGPVNSLLFRERFKRLHELLARPETMKRVNESLSGNVYYKREDHQSP